MKHTLTTLLAFCLYVGSACAQTQETEERQGSFESKRGVMDKASCHGFNIGYLQAEDGTRTVVCFDRLPQGGDLRIGCENQLWVEGYTETHTGAPEGACPGKTLQVFYVTEWKCL